MRTLLLAASLLPLAAIAQDLSPQEIDQVIARFSAKESEFAKARENYTYRQSYKFEEFGPNNRPSGKLEFAADIVFTAEGKRTERVVYAPMNTLQQIIFTPEDEQDIRNVQPFVLTSKDVNNYHVRYLGKENVDEIGCYVFAVRPKSMTEGTRYFAGQIWVDDRDLQIVKSYGRGVGVGKKVEKQRFPKFETYREQIDGKYWFPTYTSANDILMFDSGQKTPIKMVLTYKDYKQFRSESTITFGDEAKDPPAPKPPKQ
jgi:hypothetical protein